MNYLMLKSLQIPRLPLNMLSLLPFLLFHNLPYPKNLRKHSDKQVCHLIPADIQTTIPWHRVTMKTLLLLKVNKILVFMKNRGTGQLIQKWSIG